MEIQGRLTGKFEVRGVLCCVLVGSSISRVCLFVQSLVQPSRKFVKDGQLIEKRGKQVRTRQFFLFNGTCFRCDMFLCLPHITSSLRFVFPYVDAIVCAAKNALAFLGEFEFKYLVDVHHISHISPSVEDPGT